MNRDSAIENDSLPYVPVPSSLDVRRLKMSDLSDFSSLGFRSNEYARGARVVATGSMMLYLPTLD